MYRNEEYSREYDYDYEHTGDPQLDLEYERCPGLFEDVKIFLVNFRAAIKQGAIFDIQTMYESTFPALSDKYYYNTEWPNETEIAPLLEGDPVFKILYKELYYRHIHARLQGGPTSDHRFNSFFNYCDLFNLILTPNEPFLLKLPDIWLWELIDEFVYQFQNFALYRARLLDNDKDMEALSSNNNNVWSILCVLNVLHSLVEISHIKEQLEVASQGGDAHTVAGEFGEHSLYKMLGFFSLIGLLRLHSILGDYYQAIKVLEPIEIHNKSQNSPISACQISTSYYVGFAYMMMRRYADAIRTFSSILLHIQRTKQLYSTKSYQNDQINKQSDQMYHLLAICLVLHPQCIDESIQQVLREKNYNENMCKMQCGEMEAFKNFFTFACPKFVSPCPRTRENKDDNDDESIKDPFEHQLEIFMEEVRQQIKLPTIRSYLKLYTTLPIEKLASFMDLSSEEAKLLINLLCFKHKMKNMVWTKGSSGLQGVFQSGSELDFYIDNDMVHIADTKVAHRYGDFFIRKILKFEDLNRRLHNIKMK